MFYEKYLELCRANGMSPTGAGRRMGISSRTSANWALGAEPRPDTVLRIAKFFGVDVSYFYDGDDGLTDEIEETPLVRDYIKQMNELTEDERLILMGFRTLSDAGKQKLMRELMRIKFEEEK